MPTGMLPRMHRWARALPSSLLGALALLACSAAAALAAGPPFPDPVGRPGRVRQGRDALGRGGSAPRGAHRRDRGRDRRGDRRLHPARLGHQRGREPRERRCADRPVGHRPLRIRRRARPAGGARPGPRREPGQPVRRLGLPGRVRERGCAHRHHRQLVRALRPRRRLRRRRAQHDRGDRRAHGSGRPGAPRDAAHPERGTRPDRRATGPGGHPRARLAALAPRGRRSRADRLAVDPDGRPARRDDAGAGDGHPERDGHRSQHQHHPRRAGEHGPPLVPQPRPGQRGAQRRRSGSAHRSRHRGPCREPGRPRAGRARARGVGTHPGPCRWLGTPLPRAALGGEPAPQQLEASARVGGGPYRLAGAHARPVDHHDGRASASGWPSSAPWPSSSASRCR